MEIKRLFIDKFGDDAKKWKSTDFSHLFDWYDDYFFNGKLRKQLTDRKTTVDFTIKNRGTKVAGYCKQSGCNYTIAISRPNYENLFKSNEKMYRNGGLPCMDRVHCMLITFEHEMIHLLTSVFCPEARKVTNRGVAKRVMHGKTFKGIAKSRFGQTESKHALLNGFEDTKVDLNFKVGEYVSVLPKYPVCIVQKKQVKKYRLKVIEAKNVSHVGRMIDCPPSLMRHINHTPTASL